MEAATNASFFQSNPKKTLALPIALVLSFLLHLFLAGGVGLYEKYFASFFESKTPDLTWLEVAPDTPARNRVVQTEAAKKSDTAKKDALLGFQNQNVERETVSRRQPLQVGAGKSAAKSRGKAAPLAQFGMPLLPPVKQGGEAPQDAPEWAQVGARPVDFVPGVKEGERTVLNTKEFVFYGYFQRIRERLDRAWVPLIRERVVKLYRSGRSLASESDHTTRVLVILNRVGEITKVQLLSASGTEELDSTAVDAFNRAGPFPNPPSGIIDAAGEVQIPWDFILKT